MSLGLEIAGKEEQNVTLPYSHREKITLEQTTASCYNAPIAHEPHNSYHPPAF